MRRHLALAFAAPLLLATPALAQSAQGDWPCKQVRVPEIALAGVWTGPSIEKERKSWRDDAAIADLVARIAARRTPIDEAEKLIGEFSKGAGDHRKERLTTLFAGLYERMNDERRDVVNGLDRFGRRLKEMAEKTREETQAFYELQSKKPAPDAETVKKAAETTQWRVRLFEEQRKMASFVCESPALIEQRFGELARKILAEME
ncbi:hypothetical protein OGR47_00870 [Methylocystis sp. MJC1]|jgi:hypothetical protein|uniref:hypothetical protein n=1 Tax=Methylocystis sp. MJC1 TaxID=2654282 RepID=UPI0013EA9FA5|nr:hypothetical protein [Methylocystis sp. MJC1]KAF2989721.1 hypothetical protein MJC1_03274 [Methylocystis sp. MJC1]MBU6525570.1 hypothetical protein [Methylocystis sp. MJC1]UZX12050.1 hypothetical protein OGR47_00870 [Methylocystis sp. MJC1]